MTVSLCTTRLAGYVVGASVWNAEHVDNMNWVTGARPSCKAYRTSGLSVGSGSQTIMTFDLEHWDTASMHSIAVNTGRFTAPVTGRYRITTTLRPAAVGASFFSFVEPFVSGVATGDRVGQAHNSATDFGVHMVAEYSLAASAYLEMTVWHNYGAALDWTGNCLVEWTSR